MEATIQPKIEGVEIQADQSFILKSGAKIKTDKGVEVVSVSSDGLTATITGTETIIGSEVAIANGKILQGNGSGVGAEKTLGATFSGSALGTHNHAVTALFSGTGMTAAGQVMTSTDNQTMTLNQCAGMWLVITGTPATPPVLIISNTAVTGAPAVLTCQGAVATDAGTYAIYGNTAITAGTPAGTVTPTYA